MKLGTIPRSLGLVYVAAFAPQEGQSAFELASANPTPVLQQLTQDSYGFLKITPLGIREDFAQGPSDLEKTVLTATQSPTASASLGTAVSTAAWRNKPCWYVIAANDRVIAPTLQETFAEEMNATSITLSSTHVAMLSLVLPLFGPRSLDWMYSYRVDWNEPIRGRLSDSEGSVYLDQQIAERLWEIFEELLTRSLSVAA